MSRLDRWRGERRHFPLGIAIVRDNAELLELFQKAPKRAERAGTAESFVALSRELILSIRDGKPLLTCVLLTLDSEYLDVSFGPDMEIVDEDDEGMKQLLAIALASEVPVYPDDPGAATVLARLHAELLTEGFQVRSAGKTARYMLGPSISRALEIDSEQVLESYNPTASLAPADLLVIQDKLRLQLAANAEAERIVGALRAGLAELTDLLGREQRDEEALQSCLTRYPVLLGLEYRRLLPKHRLGKDYVTDFGLERHSGLVDLAEIEPSTARLFTRSGNPSSDLVHAEQQVLDWLDWIERNSSYARADAVGHRRPRVGPSAR